MTASIVTASGFSPAADPLQRRGPLTLTRDGADTPENDVSGDMFYEFNYPGVPDERAGL